MTNAQTSDTAGSHEALQLRAVRDLTKALPLNDLGLPVGIYRTDLLPWHSYETPILGVPEHLVPPPPTSPANTPEILPALLDTIDDLGFDMPVLELDEDPKQALAASPVEEVVQEEPTVPPPPVIRRIAGFIQSDLEVAFVWLHFDDGFPAFEDGEPFWGRFAFEPHSAYMAFQQYLQMPTGVSAGYDEEEEEYTGESASGTRSIGDLASSMHGDHDLLRMHEQYHQYSIMYYWGLRAQAYDMYKVVQHRKRQELRAIETQDEHYIQARKLRGRLDTYMDQEEFWEMLTPKVAIDLLKTTTGMERMSAGMNANGSSAGQEPGGSGQSMEIAYRTIAQNNNVNGGDGSGNLIEESSGEVLSQMLGDPEQAGMLQELIIKISGGGHG